MYYWGQKCSNSMFNMETNYRQHILRNNPHIVVMLQYYRKHLCHNKFKYDHTDSKWIDVDCIIFTVTMSYDSTNDMYTLDINDS